MAAQSPLRLRPLRHDDESAARAAHRTMTVGDDFPFLLGYEDGDDWNGYLDMLDRCSRAVAIPDGWVPGSLLLAVSKGETVGRASIRYELGNEFLRTEGGHIGYGVLPAHRRKGYATEILRQSLIVARSHGVDRVLITWHDTNVGSARVIEGSGGVYESTVPGSRDGVDKRRYWID